MFIISTILLLFFLLVVTFCWYKYVYAPFQLLSSLGIPHPPVVPFFGNSLELFKKGTRKSVKEWIETYGNIFGFYVGTVSFIVVADPVMIKEITVKHFDNFANRSEVLPLFSRDFLVLGSSSALSNIGKGIFFEVGDRWRKKRSILSPAFSCKKLQMMVELVERSCLSFTDRLEEASTCSSSHNIDVSNDYIMEVILATILGSHVDVLKGEGKRLTRAAKALLAGVNDSMLIWHYILTSHSSFVIKIIKILARLSPLMGHFQCLNNLFLQIIQTRRQQMKLGTVTNKDFLQLLIDTKTDDNSDSLTDEEIVGICLDFFLAGYETTSSCLIFTSYLLALNPDKQELLCQAIDNYYQENEDATLYDASHSIPYLDWVIQESLRLYPPAPATTRICRESCTVNGVTFLKGAYRYVYIPIDHLHHSSEYWDQPDVFEPNRFSTEGKEGRNPVCHLPFGWGPRNCIGMRFALMEAKMVLVSALKSYKFERGPDTQVPLKEKSGFVTSPQASVILHVTRRIFN